MDFEDDPDITPWHLSQRVKFLKKLADEEREKEEKLEKLMYTPEDPDALRYTIRNVLLRVIIAVAFLGLCIGLLAFSIGTQGTVVKMKKSFQFLLKICVILDDKSNSTASYTRPSLNVKG